MQINSLLAVLTELVIEYFALVIRSSANFEILSIKKSLKIVEREKDLTMIIISTSYN